MKKVVLAKMIVLSSFIVGFFKTVSKTEKIDLVQKEKSSKPLGRTFDKSTDNDVERIDLVQKEKSSKPLGRTFDKVKNC